MIGEGALRIINGKMLGKGGILDLEAGSRWEGGSKPTGRIMEDWLCYCRSVSLCEITQILNITNQFSKGFSYTSRISEVGMNIKHIQGFSY